MWDRFDVDEIGEDMARIKALGLDVVRFFLIWEAFQPDPGHMNDTTLRRFDALMERIAAAGLQAMPTLFCGHMSGVNWLPGWTLERDTTSGRFRTISGGSIVDRSIGDFYANPELLRAQVYFARRVGERLRDHPALFAWDLGNEFSNLRTPAATRRRVMERTSERNAARSLRRRHTGGMHGEDLEQDRNLRPSSMARPVDLSDHARLFGLQQVRARSPRSRRRTVSLPSCTVVQWKTGALQRVRQSGCPPGSNRVDGLLVSTKPRWPSTVGASSIACTRAAHSGRFGGAGPTTIPRSRELPPFDKAPHELRFGIVRSDGSLKPVAQMLARDCRAGREVTSPPPAAIADETNTTPAFPESIAPRVSPVLRNAWLTTFGR